MRPNRLKVILSEMGFKVDERQQPLNNKTLDLLGLTAKRVRQIMEGRGDKELTVKELESICSWLSVQADDILLPTSSTLHEENIKVKVRAEIHFINRGPKKKNEVAPDQRNLFANA